MGMREKFKEVLKVQRIEEKIMIRKAAKLIKKYCHKKPLNCEDCIFRKKGCAISKIPIHWEL